MIRRRTGSRIAAAALTTTLIVATTAACVSGGLLSGSGARSGQSGGSGGSGSSGGSGQSGSSDQPGASPPDFDSIAAAVSPGLVVVDSVLGYQQAEAAGTGIVLTASGEVLTNNHVIAGATSVTVTDVGDSRSYKATVVGYDRTQDVAVLSLTDASGLTTAPLETSADPSVGDQVVAIGNAGGTGSLTDAPGTVTALGQQITASDASSGSSEQLTNLIQVNADVQAGDSGGPLVDAKGRVVGVDTAATAAFRFQRSQNQQSGYAIPIATATAVAKQIATGHASSTVHIGPSAVLGVQVSDPTDGSSGAAVVGVVPGTAADTAGLAAGDVITALNGTPVTSATTLTTLMDQHHPGQTVNLTWLDQFGSAQSASVTLGTGPAG